MNVKYVVAVFLFAGMLSCKKKTPYADNIASADCNASTSSYDKEIASLLNNSCAFNGCHNQTSHKAYVILSDYENARSQFLNNKKVLASIYHDASASPMPKGKGRLPEEQIRQLVCWVKNNCPK